MTENQADHVSIVPLGGLGEFGMNIMAYECGDDIIVIDCGIMEDFSRDLIHRFLVSLVSLKNNALPPPRIRVPWAGDL